jgi:hypothetical protein
MAGRIYAYTTHTHAHDPYYFLLLNGEEEEKGGYD